MKTDIKTEKINIGGMTCINCQTKLERKLRSVKGVKKVSVSYNSGIATVTYNADAVSTRDISAVIQKSGYTVLSGEKRQKTDINRVIGFLVIIAAMYVLLEKSALLNMLAPSMLADEKMGYGMLFLIGLVTSVHCVAMCGGINLSQCIPRESGTKSSRLSVLMPACLYNLGRIASYTAVGFAVGALGSALTFSNTMQGVLKLFAGVFMIVMGINMLGIFPWLKRLSPRLPKAFTKGIDAKKSQSKSPLIVGLLNGFMPCGPLQAMQIYALSTGSPVKGALSMLLFSAGTVPLMFGLGAFSSVIGRKFTKKVMTAGAVLVAVLGLSMLSQGLNLSGFSDTVFNRTSDSTTDGTSVTVTEEPGASDDVFEDGFQTVKSTLSIRGYPSITVQKGIPVRWIIDASESSINGCNNRLIINEYNIEYTFTVGENIIEFTPEKSGTFRYSCWMGMISGTITVV